MVQGAADLRPAHTHSHSHTPELCLALLSPNFLHSAGLCTQLGLCNFVPTEQEWGQISRSTFHLESREINIIYSIFFTNSETQRSDRTKVTKEVTECNWSSDFLPAMPTYPMKHTPPNLLLEQESTTILPWVIPAPGRGLDAPPPRPLPCTPSLPSPALLSREHLTFSMKLPATMSSPNPDSLFSVQKSIHSSRPYSNAISARPSRCRDPKVQKEWGAA
jgi:hypothetical protein